MRTLNSSFAYLFQVILILPLLYLILKPGIYIFDYTILLFFSSMGFCFSTVYDEKNRFKKTKLKLKPFVAEEVTASTCITEEELRKYIDDVFNKYDRNGDNFLEKKEIRLMLKQLARKKGKDPTPEEIEVYTERFMRKTDVKGDGKIGRNQFFNYYKGM